MGPRRKPSIEMIVDLDENDNRDSDDEDMPGLAACGSDNEGSNKDQDTELEEWEESAEEELSKL